MSHSNSTHQKPTPRSYHKRDAMAQSEHRFQCANTAVGTAKDTITSLENSTESPSQKQHEKSLLGTTAKIAAIFADFPPEIAAYVLQDKARKLIPRERVSQCLRVPAPTAATIEIHRSTETNRAQFRNLIVCARLWQCPVCARRISEQRRKELTRAINQSDLHPLLATLTIKHNSRMPLEMTLGGLKRAFKALTSYREYKQLKTAYGLAGHIKAIEITYGANGWHPHMHLLMFTTAALAAEDVARLEVAMRKAWLTAIGKCGFSGNRHALDLRTGNQYIAEYVSKFGREPLRKTSPKVASDETWTVAHEVAKGVSKKARGDESLTPLGLLAASDDQSNPKTARQAAGLWLEYYRATKGSHHLQWSRGLKSRIGIETVSDEAAALELETVWDEIAGIISRSDWYEVFIHTTAIERAGMLQAAAIGAEALTVYLNTLYETIINRR